MIRITPSLWFDERELEETFVRASGPGGQHVNKTSSAVQLRFDARRSRSLPPDVVERLIELAGNRATQEGVVVITAQRHRSQPLNRADALERLVELIRRATVRETIRRPTAPTRASKRRRLEEKSRRGQVKALRRATGSD
nr:aminoacyl-tRNA hydrolase [Pseudomonas sp.]